MGEARNSAKDVKSTMNAATKPFMIQKYET